MTSAANIDTIGTPQINSDFVLDSTQRVVMGTIVSANDNYWGGGEFIYAYYAGTIPQFGLVTIIPTFDSTLNRWRYEAVAAPNTANMGKSLGVAMVGGVAGNYGWIKISGTVPINGTASVAADTAFGITAAGQIGANSAGKQVLNGRVVAPATTTVVKSNCYAQNNSKQLQVPNSDGWFIGAYLSGTGIAAGTTVVAIGPGGRFVTLSAATTAQVNGDVTATYNNGTVYYSVAYINRPFAQGAIT